MIEVLIIICLIVIVFLSNFNFAKYRTAESGDGTWGNGYISEQTAASNAREQQPAASNAREQQPAASNDWEQQTMQDENIIATDQPVSQAQPAEDSPQAVPQNADAPQAANPPSVSAEGETAKGSDAAATIQPKQYTEPEVDMSKQTFLNTRKNRKIDYDEELANKETKAAHSKKIVFRDTRKERYYDKGSGAIVGENVGQTQ